MITKAKQRAQKIRLTAKESAKALRFLRSYMKEYMPAPLPRSSPHSPRRGAKSVNRKPISEY